MKITLTRFANNGQATLSTVIVDGVPFFAIEDEPREVTVADETRIPAGTYAIKLRDDGGMTKHYAEMFPDMHAGMLWLQDVPGFEWIYIHIGNFESQTSGCILIGEGCRAPARDRWAVTESKAGYERFYRLVMAAAMAGELEVEIIDRDRG